MWTFTDSRDEWIYEEFANKEEAILAGKIIFDGNFFVGQLIEREYFDSVENVEEISN